jgi:hypothetical protein
VNSSDNSVFVVPPSYLADYKPTSFTGRSQSETLAQLLVKYCKRNGDIWRDIPIKDFLRLHPDWARQIPAGFFSPRVNEFPIGQALRIKAFLAKNPGMLPYLPFNFLSCTVEVIGKGDSRLDSLTREALAFWTLITGFGWFKVVDGQSLQPQAEFVQAYYDNMQEYKPQTA